MPGKRSAQAGHEALNGIVPYHFDDDHSCPSRRRARPVRACFGLAESTIARSSKRAPAAAVIGLGCHETIIWYHINIHGDGGSRRRAMARLMQDGAAADQILREVLRPLAAVAGAAAAWARGTRASGGRRKASSARARRGRA
jgi:hypothetical protein